MKKVPKSQNIQNFVLKPSALFGATWAKQMVTRVEDNRLQHVQKIIDDVLKGKYGTKNRAELILELEALL